MLYSGRRSHKCRPRLLQRTPITASENGLYSFVSNAVIAAAQKMPEENYSFKPMEFLEAKAAYQDFLTLWKDADPDIPILKQAKAEYAKLQ